MTNRVSLSSRGLEGDSAILIQSGTEVYTRDELARHGHNKQFRSHYEMSADDENGDGVHAGTWTEVASGDLGDVIYWKAGFKALGKVQSILSQLEEIGEENVDWEELIGEHSYFAGIESADFPPLYDASDFQTCFDDFLAIVKEPTEHGMPGQTFDSLDLYVANDKKEKVVQEFTDFLQHLKTLKPLRDAGIV